MIEKGFSREKAYDLVQPLAIKAWEEKESFLELLKNNEEINSEINKEELEDIFDINFYLSKVDEIYKRVF